MIIDDLWSDVSDPNDLLVVAATWPEEGRDSFDEREAIMTIRRCVEQIVVSHNEGQCRITFRRIPTIAGESLAAATDGKVVQFGATTDRSPRAY